MAGRVFDHRDDAHARKAVALKSPKPLAVNEGELVLGRALVGIYDLFGVTWLRKRTLVPKVTEQVPQVRR